jgi:hypothetical protein
MNGKGSKQRPLSVPYDEFEIRWDSIFRKRYTPNNILELKENQVFVFGSNEAGIHGAGAAKLANNKFGATWGVGVGITGNCYAIPTKNTKIKTLPLSRIETYIAFFLSYAKQHPEKEFLVTKIGCGLAGYSEEEIASLFKNKEISDNVIMPESFCQIIKFNE